MQFEKSNALYRDRFMVSGNNIRPTSRIQVKFIDVAIIHKVYHIKNGKEADAIFVDRILPP